MIVLYAFAVGPCSPLFRFIGQFIERKISSLLCEDVFLFLYIVI